MCGIVGIAGDLMHKDEATMKRLLILDVFRGMDSTGLAAIRSNGEVKTAKIASHPLDLFDMQRFKDALNGNMSRAFIGHNRHATKGGVSGANAHPFTFDHITGVHNGTLIGSDHRALEDAIGEKYNVDSQALFAAIAKLGLKQTIEMCREGSTSSDGAWSIVYHDATDQSINFLRNKHRPMWYAFTKDFKRMFFASEWPMIEAAARMGIGYDLFTEEGTGHRFWQTMENMHYRFSLEKLRNGSEAPPKPVVREVKGKEPYSVVSVGTSGNNSPFPQRNSNTNNGGNNTSTSNVITLTNNSTTKSTTSTASTPKVVHLLGCDDSPFAGLIKPEQFASMARHGCGFCKQPVDINDKGLLIFERDDLIICNRPGCASDDGETNTRIYTKVDLQL